jgi:hypothetical protein
MIYDYTSVWWKSRNHERTKTRIFFVLSRFRSFVMMKLTALLAVFVLFASQLNAQPPKSVDDQLLEDEPAATKPEPTKDKQGQHDPPAGHPLSKLADEMRDAQKLLAQRRSDALTQRKQQQIADALAALLKQAQGSKKSPASPANSAKPKPDEKFTAGQKGGTGATGDNPKGKESVERHGPVKTTRADAAQLASAIQDRWGHLPAGVYEEVVQAARGQFLTQYQLEIEKYFERLLEQGDVPKR